MALPAIGAIPVNIMGEDEVPGFSPVELMAQVNGKTKGAGANVSSTESRGQAEARDWPGHAQAPGPAVSRPPHAMPGERASPAAGARRHL